MIESPWKANLPAVFTILLYSNKMVKTWHVNGSFYIQYNTWIATSNTLGAWIHFPLNFLCFAAINFQCFFSLVNILVNILLYWHVSQDLIYLCRSTETRVSLVFPSFGTKGNERVHHRSTGTTWISKSRFPCSRHNQKAPWTRRCVDGLPNFQLVRLKLSLIISQSSCTVRWYINLPNGFSHLPVSGSTEIATLLPPQ